MGIKTIAISVGEDTRTIEDVYEPYLIRIGFIKRSPQGREATAKAKAYTTKEYLANVTGLNRWNK